MDEHKRWWKKKEEICLCCVSEEVKVYVNVRISVIYLIAFPIRSPRFMMWGLYVLYTYLFFLFFVFFFKPASNNLQRVC